MSRNTAPDSACRIGAGRPSTPRAFRYLVWLFAVWFAAIGCGGGTSSGGGSAETAPSGGGSAVDRSGGRTASDTVAAAREPDGNRGGGASSRSGGSSEGSSPAAQRDSARYEVLVFGNSITAGSGVADAEAFPALLQQKVDSLGWSVRIIEAGVSGETTAGGLRRIEHVMRSGIEVMVLELGGNDGLRGTDPSSIRSNLQQIVDRARSINPELRIILTGIRMPPNMGPTYTDAFRQVYRDLAASNELVLIPRLLEGVGGRPEFMQSDGIHPNVRGHRRVAETVWEELRPVLEELGAGPGTTARVLPVGAAVEPLSGPSRDRRRRVSGEGAACEPAS